VRRAGVLVTALAGCALAGCAGVGGERRARVDDAALAGWRALEEGRAAEAARAFDARLASAPDDLLARFGRLTEWAEEEVRVHKYHPHDFGDSLLVERLGPRISGGQRIDLDHQAFSAPI